MVFNLQNKTRKNKIITKKRNEILNLQIEN